MTRGQLLLKLLPIQMDYDKLVFDAYLDGKRPKFIYVYRALIDEVGEWNHEEKSMWGYWKKTQKPINRENHLEEYVDVLHFQLLMVHMIEPDFFRKYEIGTPEWDSETDEFTKGMSTDEFWLFQDHYLSSLTSYLHGFNLLECEPDSSEVSPRFRNKSVMYLHHWMIISMAYMQHQGYSLEEIEAAYLHKNEVNRSRVSQGY